MKHTLPLVRPQGRPGLCPGLSSTGVYWVVPGVRLSFAAGVFGAWVLLVEIQH